MINAAFILIVAAFAWYPYFCCLRGRFKLIPWVSAGLAVIPGIVIGCGTLLMLLGQSTGSLDALYPTDLIAKCVFYLIIIMVVIGHSLLMLTAEWIEDGASYGASYDGGAGIVAYAILCIVVSTYLGYCLSVSLFVLQG